MNDKDKAEKALTSMREAIRQVREGEIRPPHLIQEGVRAYTKECTGSDCKICKGKK